MRLIAVLGLDPRKLIDSFGLIGLGVIVFAESGLLIGFFLPGDSLLFTAGLLTATENAGRPIFDHPIWLVMLVCMVCAVVGDQVGYQFGKRVGPALFDRPRSRLFRPAHMVSAQQFFERHGSRTIVLARFVPIVRTFAPIVAGVGQMPYRTFTMFNVVGGVLWGGGLTLLGWALGSRYKWMGDKIEVLAMIVVAVSLLPVAFEFIRHRRSASVS